MGRWPRNIATSGLETRAWNRTREKCEPLAEHGVTVADTPADAVSGADVVVTMLADGYAVDQVVTEGGALEAMSDDAVWIQASTIGIEATERLLALAEERGLTFVDSPVLGTKKPAEDGALTVLASGPEDAHEACAPIFDAVGSRTVWARRGGSGDAAEAGGEQLDRVDARGPGRDDRLRAGHRRGPAAASST